MADDPERGLASTEIGTADAIAQGEMPRKQISDAFCETLLSQHGTLNIFEFAQLIALCAKAST